MARLFIIPLLLCLVWIIFLRIHGLPLQQGKNGFIVIAIGSSALLLFLSLMLWLTKP